MISVIFLVALITYMWFCLFLSTQSDFDFEKLKIGKNNQIKSNISSQFWVIVQFHPGASI